MGVVYQAVDPDLARPVALKVIAAHLASPDAWSRFRREAQSIARLHHPNIVQVYEFGEAEGAPFIAMELVPGTNLHDARLSGSRAGDLRSALQPILDICNALEAAHANGIVHRDIKPSNIRLLTDGRACLIDFGLASLAGNDLTLTGQLLGTPAYLAPEGFRSSQVDGRADIFSLAVTCFEWLSDRRPFDRGSSAEIVDGEILSLGEYVADAPTELSDALARAMSSDPDDRYQTVTAFREALQSVVPAGDVPLKILPGTPARRPRWFRLRDRRAVGTAALGVFLGVAVIGVTWRAQSDPRRELAAMGTSWSGEAFLEAVRTGDLRVVRLFLAGGMPLASATSQGRPLSVMLALNVTNPAAVLDVLADGGLDINQRYEVRGGFGPVRTTLLSYAIDKGNADLVSGLLRHRAAVNSPIQTFGAMGSARDTYPLASAIFWDQIGIAETLIEHGADPSVGDFAAFREAQTKLPKTRDEKARSRIKELMTRLAPTGTTGTRIGDELRLQAVERELTDVAVAGFGSARGSTGRSQSDQRYDELQRERTQLRSRLGISGKP